MIEYIFGSILLMLLAASLAVGLFDLIGCFTLVADWVLQKLGLKPIPPKPTPGGVEGLIGRPAFIVKSFERGLAGSELTGKVKCDGALWDAFATQDNSDGLHVGDQVRVERVEGLKLVVVGEARDS